MIKFMKRINDNLYSIYIICYLIAMIICILTGTEVNNTVLAIGIVIIGGYTNECYTCNNDKIKEMQKEIDKLKAK